MCTDWLLHSSVWHHTSWFKKHVIYRILRLCPRLTLAHLLCPSLFNSRATPPPPKKKSQISLLLVGWVGGSADNTGGNSSNNPRVLDELHASVHDANSALFMCRIELPQRLPRNISSSRMGFLWDLQHKRSNPSPSHWTYGCWELGVKQGLVIFARGFVRDQRRYFVGWCLWLFFRSDCAVGYLFTKFDEGRFLWFAYYDRTNMLYSNWTTTFSVFWPNKIFSFALIYRSLAIDLGIFELHLTFNNRSSC